MKYLFLAALCITLILPACKKDQSSNTGSLIIGKWTILPSTYELYTNGSLSSSSSQQYAATDYGDFKTNGTFQTLTNGTVYNYQYTLSGDSIIFDNINKAKIKTLTATNLSYFFRDSINPTQFRINTFYFKK